MSSLKNKIVFITGASAGIGEACAKLLAAQGAKLILTARRLERLETLKKELKTPVYIIQLDVSDAKAVEQAIDALPEDWKNIDILINNAGLASGLELLADAFVEQFDRMIDTNIKGLLYVTRAVLPLMIENQKGHIVNLASIAGHVVYPKGIVYSATKHAVRAITNGLRQEVHGKNIRVTDISPGAVETEFSLVRFGDAEKAAKVYEGYDPLTASDIADAIIYALSRPQHVSINDIVITPTAQLVGTALGFAKK
jgi:3-hydroxy acid dehydrogenase/malonic semialdehyde reductase